jgi:C-terminal processing protease CtpA/Prc
MIIKDGSVNRSFFSKSFVEGHILNSNHKFKKIPPELLNEDYYIVNSTDTINPSEPVKFKGKIFLLVSKTVFSSSEGFAQFCKSTRWATVVGEQTGGDGNGRDPIIISLPESGLLLTYPALVGLNSDGSLNFETKTIPDIKIDADNSEERLDKLINYLIEK